MSRVILDTDTLSEILKGKNQAVVRTARLYAYEHGKFTFTAVSAHEILYGLQFRDAMLQLERAKASFALNEVVLPDMLDYEVSGRVRGVARKVGYQLALDDCLIGAIAARLGLPVITGNRRHFAAMQEAGLSLVIGDWREKE